MHKGKIVLINIIKVCLLLICYYSCVYTFYYLGACMSQCDATWQQQCCNKNMLRHKHFADMSWWYETTCQPHVSRSPNLENPGDMTLATFQTEVGTSTTKKRVEGMNTSLFINFNDIPYIHRRVITYTKVVCPKRANLTAPTSHLTQTISATLVTVAPELLPGAFQTRIGQ